MGNNQKKPVQNPNQISDDPITQRQPQIPQPPNNNTQIDRGRYYTQAPKTNISVNPENFDPESEMYNYEAEREVQSYLDKQKKADEERQKRFKAAENKEKKQQLFLEQKKIERFEEQKKEEQKIIEFKMNLYERKINKVEEEEKFNKYLSEIFKKDLLHHTLTEVLEPKIFKTHEKYSPQEKDAIESDENFVLLGRSGTGKTLVAMTKMFLLNVCSNLTETKKLIKGITKENFYLRMIFTTTSPNLIEEVSKYYMLMEKKFKDAVEDSQKKSGDDDQKIKKIKKNSANTVLSLTTKEVKYNTFDELQVNY